MKIFISTANQYMHLLKPFAYLFNRFWNNLGGQQKVTVLGYDTPTFSLPDNFDFISMGKQDGGIQAWSTDLRKFFESIDDKFFIWATEDMFLTHYVRSILMDYIYRNFLTDDLGRFGLTNDNKGRPYEKVPHIEERTWNIIESLPLVDYRLSVLWSIWNRDYLLKYLEPGMSPWEFEINGSEKARGDGYRILGCVGDNYKYPLHQCLAVRKQNLDQPLNFRAINNGIGLETEYIDELKKEGFIDEENRISVSND